MPKKVTIPRLKNALRIAARIVVLHGDEYFVLFEKLENELKRLEAMSNNARARAQAYLDGVE